VRLVFQAKDEYESQWAAIVSISSKIGCSPETLWRRIRQQERDTGQRKGPSTAKQERVKALEREVRELRKANEILRLASPFFCPGGARPPLQVMRDFIDQHREVLGVASICKVCRLPRRDIGVTLRGGAIRHCAVCERNVTTLQFRTLSGCGRPTCKSTERTKSGGSFAEKAWWWPVVRSNASCDAKACAVYAGVRSCVPR